METLEKAQLPHPAHPIVEAQISHKHPPCSPTTKDSEEIDSDPFALAPLINEAFHNRKPTLSIKPAKATSKSMDPINKRKAWEEFLIDLESDEDRNCSNRKGKMKSKNSKRGRKGKSKPRASPPLKEMGRVTPTGSDINRCNDAFWRRNCIEEAELVFENSKLMDFSLEKDREILLFQNLLKWKKETKGGCWNRRRPNRIGSTREEMVCIQETKREVINKEFCESIWPDKDFGWAFSGSSGTSGGLLTIWKISSFYLENQWGVPGALAIKGNWHSSVNNFCLINTYAPSRSKDQQRLWEDIQLWINGQQELTWCVCGDFNTRSRQFCKFISNLELVNLPLLRRKFTWYKDNGSCCSRIDRFLLSKKWCFQWPNLKQTGLKRTFSDHAPLLLEATDNIYWGPIPFKIVNWWIDLKEFRLLVENSWKDVVINGWGSFVLQEKLKRVEAEIKSWKKKFGTSMSKEIAENEEKLFLLDSKLESKKWEDEDREHRRALQLELEEKCIRRDRLAAQKSRSKWLSEGDANSRFFHAMVNHNNKKSKICSLKINNQWLEGVNQIRDVVFLYF
ncbi:hypothetical protein ACS0TY_024620 [Phlomoides rotata]